ncbi:MAG: hypothetical protein K6D93_08375 [Saccharofermentans sp.]|nr:hypothetical protein [Saccharofermentans sp.]
MADSFVLPGKAFVLVVLTDFLPESLIQNKPTKTYKCPILIGLYLGLSFELLFFKSVEFYRFIELNEKSQYNLFVKSVEFYRIEE